jgi:hypothetical protein
MASTLTTGAVLKERVKDLASALRTGEALEGATEDLVMEGTCDSPNLISLCLFVYMARRRSDYQTVRCKQNPTLRDKMSPPTGRLAILARQIFHEEVGWIRTFAA